MTSREILGLELAKIAALALSENENVRPQEVLELTAGLIDLIAEKQSALLCVFTGGGEA